MLRYLKRWRNKARRRRESAMTQKASRAVQELPVRMRLDLALFFIAAHIDDADADFIRDLHEFACAETHKRA